jgi:lipopolysaccharide transport system ATP-binding protein
MGIAIQVENLSKQYRLGSVGTGALTHDVNRWWHKLRGLPDPYLKIGEENDRATTGGSDYVWALRDVSFEVPHGQVLGIIGRNGAGKSTLLKLLSRTTGPTAGRIRLQGRVASLLEVGTGFHPDLTGRENIFLNGAILGMTTKEIRRKYEAIVEFSGVRRYIETPVKRYSSGMYVRLAFAVAAHLDPEILIVDEVLAVGDIEFQNKCLGKMKEVSAQEGRTVLFVTHNMGAIQKLCDAGLLLTNGRLEAIGKVDDVVRRYVEVATPATGRYVSNPRKSGTRPVWFERILLTDHAGNLKDEFMHDEDIYICYELGYAIDPNRHDYSIFCTIIDHLKNRVFSAESAVISTTSVRLKIEGCSLVRGRYSLHTFVHKPRTEQIDVAEDVCGFSVIDNGSPFNIHGDYDYGRVFGRVKWVYGI